MTTDGETSGELLLPEGTHIISLKGTDSVGLEGTDTVTIQVQGDNRAPTCSITSPTDSTGFVEGTEVVFTGTAEDEDVPSDWLSVSWDSDQDGNLATSNASVDGLTEVTTSSLSFNTHQITLTVTDDAGEVCQSSIQVQVGRPPSVNFTSPSDGGIWNDGESATFSATVSDDADAPNEVALVWSSDVDGDFSSARADASGAEAYSSEAPNSYTPTVFASLRIQRGVHPSGDPWLPRLLPPPCDRTRASAGS